MESFTIYNETEYDVDMDDIIDNLSSFSDSELERLMETLDSNNNNSGIVGESMEIKNLDDYHKVGILKEMFDKYSWSELEEIKKSL
jgi:hypothetical protein